MNNSEPITVSRYSSLEERQSALYQIYQQVLERQPYAYERKRLAKAEKDFLTDKIGVKRFLKELGHSEIYLNSFYYNSSNTKFVEWCFKHFLARAPLSHSEIEFYCKIMTSKGVAPMITSLLDSEEYRKAFGCFTVPHQRKQRCYASPKAYNESRLLNEEHIGRRGRFVPTRYWQQLGLNCESGVCRHPEADEDLKSAITEADLSQLLKLLQSAQSEKTIAALSPQQKSLLRRAIG